MQFKLIVFLALLLSMPSAANAGWKRATSDNFVVYSNGSEDRLRAFTAKVEAFDSLLRVVSGLKAPPAPKRLEIYLLRDANSIQKLLGRRGRNVAGLYEAKMTGAVALVPRTEGSDKYDLDGETVLFHEYAHHFMMQYFATAYPPWYVEGFAEFYSTAEVDSEKGTAAIGKPAYHRAYGLTLSTPFPIKRLLADKPDYKNAQEGDAYYGRAWLLTHMFSFMPERREQLGGYLSAYASGVNAEKAAIDAFGPIADLDKDLKKYLKANRMSYRQLSGLTIKAASVNIVTLSAAEDALIPERLGLTMGVDDQQKAAFIADVRKQTALFAESPYALDLLAETELLAEDEAAAIAANEKLLKIAPDHVPALLRKAEMMAGSTEDIEDDEAFWKKVRTLIIRANRLQNENPVALYHYYTSFRRQGINPTDIAVSGLIRAYQLAPQSTEIRFTLAAQMIEQQDYGSARAVILPVAFDPHGEGRSEAAQEILARIDTLQSKVAADTLTPTSDD